MPATHKKAVRLPRPATARLGGGGEGAYRTPRGHRDGYRSKKDEGAPGEYMPQFTGVGRGAPRKWRFRILTDLRSTYLKWWLGFY